MTWELGLIGRGRFFFFSRMKKGKETAAQTEGLVCTKAFRHEVRGLYRELHGAGVKGTCIYTILRKRGFILYPVGHRVT